MVNATVRFRISAFLLLLFFVFSLASCGDENVQVEDLKPKQKIYYSYFDTVSVFYDYSGMEKEKFDELSDSVEKLISSYHTLFDAYNEYDGITNIATLNRLAGTGAVKVDGELIKLLSFCQKMYEATGGKVNFAMGSVTKLWKTLPPYEDRIPTEAELSEAGAHISPDSVKIDTVNSTVEITDPKLRIDVGAIAKGYTAQMVKEVLAALGYNGLVIDMGGNLCAVGTKPSGNGWKSGVKNPLYPASSADPYSRTVTLLGDSLVTSGTYERYYVIDGVSYHHIIDTETLVPENRYLSVTIQTENSGVADALSTAIFNMELSEAEAFVASFDEKIEVTLILSDGACRVLSNQK